MNEPETDERDLQREQEDELIRQYLLAQATEWAEYERVYGFMREWKVKLGATSKG